MAYVNCSLSQLTAMGFHPYLLMNALDVWVHQILVRWLSCLMHVPQTALVAADRHPHGVRHTMENSPRPPLLTWASTPLSQHLSVPRPRLQIVRARKRLNRAPRRLRSATQGTITATRALLPSHANSTITQPRFQLPAESYRAGHVPQMTTTTNFL